MSKRRVHEDSERLDEVMDALFPDINELSSEEVEAMLLDGGCDLEEQRRRLHEAAREIARRQRAKGSAARPYLKRVIEQTGDASVLPSKPADALRKAQRALASFFSPPPLGTRPEVVRAFRESHSGEFSERDRRTIESLEEELVKRTEKERNE